MSVRQSRNVSLPPEQDAFVDRLVASGRYRTASEVVRDGLRLLEAAEHRRLLERWLYDGLDEEETARLPAEVRERARAYFARLLDEARSPDAPPPEDATEVFRRLRAGLTARDA